MGQPIRDCIRDSRGIPVGLPRVGMKEIRYLNDGISLLRFPCAYNFPEASELVENSRSNGREWDESYGIERRHVANC